MNTNEPRITAYNGVFMERLNKLIANIRKIRRDPTKKEKLKSLLNEAKQIRRDIKNTKIHHNIPYNIALNYTIIEGALQLDLHHDDTSNELDVTDIINHYSVTSTNDNPNIIIINFNLKA